ncbi:MAG TPA: hypothetical protein HA282_01920 [Nanoarchaeota archaeon]|nr:MAG: hypothetical protein QT01_C0006G0017 [archaeon GW2011_AR6]MBS3082819.1 FAD-dependent thymidylate synthase [Candidatus Pacearchaeota archaeon]HIH18000.1 hypothetical protein [Nanoarchaeota archaeon]HIH34459.1 hypothetical protein [Nanoarchaeota archaeon]HIH50963.1 hypothetical protein [Nanoarchaeota archaeon]
MVNVKEADGEKRVEYTPEEREKALSYFVTSPTDPIYACTHNLPPEVFGAFGSFFSRNPKDMREHLFDAIIGTIPGHELPTEDGAENLRKLVEGHYESPAEALKAGISKSQQFFNTFYGKYSHKSIANVVWIPMVMNNVSQLTARQLAYDQLSFFIEQSTRFVKFDTGQYYRDPDVMQSSLADVYEEAMQELTGAYSKSMDFGREHYKREIPFNIWLERQDEDTRGKSEGFQQRKYSREIDAKVFDDVRFLLPQAIQTNIAFIEDARSLEYDIAAWKGHSLHEIRENAELLEKHAGQIAPSIIKYTEENRFYGEQYREFDESLATPFIEVTPQSKSARIIDADPKLLDKFIAAVLKRNNTGTFSQFLDYVGKEMSLKDKIVTLERIVANRKAFDEWICVEETADLPKVLVEIVTDVGATRDLRRHQKNDRDESRYTLDMGYTIPPAIEREDGYGKEAKEIFVGAMEKAHDAEREIRKKFPHQAQYIIPMACNHSLTMSLGLDQLQYLIYTRSTPEGNWSYRKDMFNLAEQVMKTYPWIVGYKSYPKEKSVIEAYEQAPFTRKMRERQENWQGIKKMMEDAGEKFDERAPYPTPLILRTQETGLHQ